MVLPRKINSSFGSMLDPISIVDDKFAFCSLNPRLQASSRPLGSAAFLNRRKQWGHFVPSSCKSPHIGMDGLSRKPVTMDVGGISRVSRTVLSARKQVTQAAHMSQRVFSVGTSSPFTLSMSSISPRRKCSSFETLPLERLHDVWRISPWGLGTGQQERVRSRREGATRPTSK